MNYSELVEVMHQFRVGTLSRPEMVAALALWQRPVECAKAGVRAALDGIIHA